MNNSKKIYPPATIGVLGGGQLGRMLAQEAKKMGYKVITLDAVANCPCAQVCDEQIVAEFGDKSKALSLAQKSDVLTYEFENIPAQTVKYLEEKGFSVFPDSRVLEVTQNRVREKEFLKEIGIKTTYFQEFSDLFELKEILKNFGMPAVIKTAKGGYDGKGQVVLKTGDDFRNIEERLFSKELIYEKFVPFEKEISIICARDKSGKMVTFPVSENIHHNNILYMSIVPARISADLQKKAANIAKRVAQGLEGIGVIGVEMFLLEDGEILVNEIAPRVHNSAHYSIEACYTSQFEQHIRAICGLPLGSTDLLSPAVMVNILGGPGVDKKAVLCGMDKALNISRLNLHLYGKNDVKPGRKMGHLTVMADTVDEAIKQAEKAKKNLRWS